MTDLKRREKRSIAESIVNTSATCGILIHKIKQFMARTESNYVGRTSSMLSDLAEVGAGIAMLDEESRTMESANGAAYQPIKDRIDEIRRQLETRTGTGSDLRGVDVREVYVSVTNSLECIKRYTVEYIKSISR